MGDFITTKFEKMGARVKVMVDRLARLSIDIRRDSDGEYFNLRHASDVEVRVLDVRPGEAHLLLMAITPQRPGERGGVTKSKFLCGHDERAWFVAAIPETARATNVQDARDALKPAEVWQSIRDHGVKPSRRDRRRTAAFLRQGEWFFLPRPWMSVPDAQVLHREPIRRGGGKPHLCERLHRQGGEGVWVSALHPNGISDAAREALPARQRKRSDWRWMTRNARVFVRGAVRHPDHATIYLPYWHQVVMNTETRSRAMAEVAFLD